MKNKIIEALKNKYKHLGLGDKAIEGAATFLEPSIKEESEIETAVAGVEPLLKAFQSDTDAIRTAKTAAEKRLAEMDAKIKAIGGAAAGEPAEGADGEEDDSKTPPWAKALIQSNKELREEVATMKGEKVTSTRKQQLDAIVGKLPENLRKPYSRISIPTEMSDEDFATMTAEITTEVEGLLADTSARGAVFGVPGASNKGGSTKKEATDADIDALAAHM